MTLSFAVVVASMAAAAASEPATAPVRAVLDAQIAAWNRGDLDAFMETYGRLSFDDIEVEPLAPGLALARGGFRLAFRDGKGAHGRFTLLMRERPEGWRIVYDHSSSGD